MMLALLLLSLLLAPAMSNGEAADPCVLYVTLIR